MLWIFPTGFVLDIGIILFSVPGLEFAYSQAPASMKSVIMAGWLLTTGLGNLIIVIIQAINLFEKSVSKVLILPFFDVLMLCFVAELQFSTLFRVNVFRCCSFRDNGY